MGRICTVPVDCFQMDQARVIWEGAVHWGWIAFRWMRPQSYGNGLYSIYLLLTWVLLPLPAGKPKIKFLWNNTELQEVRQLVVVFLIATLKYWGWIGCHL